MPTKSVLAAVLVLAASASPAAAADRPNFVWILSEDNSMHYLRHWDPHGARAPAIEALAEQGVTFDRAFSNSPVCSVARTTLITSCYAPRAGTQFHRKAALAPMPDGVRMFPAYLREAGYHTTNNAKTDYNAGPADGVWDESSKTAHWRDRRDGQPFFHKVSFAASHESSLHFSAAEMAQQPTQTDSATVFIPPIFPDTPTFRYTIARYHDRIREIDRQVANVVAELEADGLLEDTFVFYFGDHGGVLPRSKGYAYQTGLHVPLVVRVPKNWRHTAGHAPGSRTHGFVSFVDFGPTVLHLAGAEPPAATDGRPFLGQGAGVDELAARDESFGYADRFDEKSDQVRTLRKGRFTYVRSYQPFNFDALHNDYRYKMLAYMEWRDLYGEGKLDDDQSAFFRPRAAEALYDVEADPYETTNLADDPAHAPTLAAMRERLGTIVRGLPDLSFFPESTLVAEAMDDPVGYGQEHAEEIAALAGLADLQLVNFAGARDTVARSLESENPHHRFWGLIVCSAHGTEAAKVFAGRARELATSDPDPLVRTRAAEFLGLTGMADPRPFVLDALADAPSPVAANLILNSAVLLEDGEPGYDFTVEDAPFAGRYIAYLNRD